MVEPRGVHDALEELLGRLEARLTLLGQRDPACRAAERHGGGVGHARRLGGVCNDEP